MMLRKSKVTIEKIIQPLGIVSPSEIAMKNGLYCSYWFNVGIMEQMLQEIEQHRSPLNCCFDVSIKEHPVAQIVNKHELDKLINYSFWR